MLLSISPYSPLAIGCAEHKMSYKGWKGDPIEVQVVKECVLADRQSLHLFYASHGHHTCIINTIKKGPKRYNNSGRGY